MKIYKYGKKRASENDSIYILDYMQTLTFGFNYIS